MFKRILTLAGLLILFNVSHAQNLTFKDWDDDTDGKIELHEFVDNFVEYHYADVDVTNDYGLDDEDFFHYTYDFMDEDGDGLVNDEEWDYAYNYLYSDFLINDGIVYYDLDNDGYISYTEFYDTMYDTDFYSVWDVDNDLYISEYELANAIFDNWDINNSGTLSKGEYANLDAFYLDM